MSGNSNEPNQLILSIFQGLQTSSPPKINWSPRSPNLNEYAERFVRTIKESCLDNMIQFGEPAFREAVFQFVEHYRQERNHEGLIAERQKANAYH